MEPTPDTAGTKATRQCGHCRHFCNDPAMVESVFKGLSAMSSGYGSVRAHDGLCALHDVYLSYRDTCAGFEAVAPVR
ncbi:MAG: hypothetical protein QM755_18950 [Luteolibacter sp.]